MDSEINELVSLFDYCFDKGMELFREHSSEYTVKGLDDDDISNARYLATENCSEKFHQHLLDILKKNNILNV